LDSLDAIADLERRFGIAGAARVAPGNGGLAKVEVSVPGGKGEIYLHGAHVTSWIPKATAEVLFLSPNSIWKDGHAIRGGVPVSFPWFADKAGDAAAPAHGFVRTKAWQLESIEKASDEVVVSLSTASDDGTRKWWLADFGIVCRATFGSALRIELMVSNSGASHFTFEEALHAYFLVGSVEAVSVHGLDATDFIDKNDKHIVKRQNGDVHLKSATDSVYLNTQQELVLIDSALKRRIGVQKENSLATVIWNPWAEKSRSMGDLGPGQWKEFICIETSNVTPHTVKLAPGQRHSMAAVIRTVI
jgi:glucose-6-phosphate 1-epimerase